MVRYVITVINEIGWELVNRIIIVYFLGLGLSAKTRVPKNKNHSTEILFRRAKNECTEKT